MTRADQQRDAAIGRIAAALEKIEKHLDKLANPEPLYKAENYSKPTAEELAGAIDALGKASKVGDDFYVCARCQEGAWVCECKQGPLKTTSP